MQFLPPHKPTDPGDQLLQRHRRTVTVSVSTVRYALIGLGCAILANMLIIGAGWLGIHYAVANIISLFGLGWIAYAAHSRWTFRRACRLDGYLRFVLGTAGGALLVTAMLFLGVDILKQRLEVASPVATVLVTIWNYATARWAITGASRR